MNETSSAKQHSSLSLFKQVHFFGKSMLVAFDVNPALAQKGKINTVGSLISFCLCHRGSSTVRINNRKRTFTKGDHLVIVPNSYVTLIDISSDFDCSIISICPEFKQERRYLSNLPLIDAILFLKEQTTMPMSENHQEFFVKMRDLLVITMKSTNEAYAQELILELVQSFFIWEQAAVATFIKTTTIKKSSHDIMATRFLSLVNDHYRTDHRLSFYSGKMFVTAKYLSAVIKSVTGRSASQWIDLFLIEEAQNLLTSTTKSVAEISDELGFPNQSFFGKYFKHHVGKGPLAYRLNK